LDYLTGNDPAKVAQLLTDVANTPASDNIPGPASDTVTTSGPAQGTPWTTSTPTPTGRTDTTGTQNITYNNNVVTITETVTNNYYDQSGNLTGTNNTPPTESVAPATNSTLPAVTDFYTQKYPNGFGGIWTTRSAQMQNSAFLGLITALNPNFGNAGTCPSFQMPGPLLGVSMGGNFAPPCWIWDALKAILIVTALFMARRIIFGG
jgi:hypothetical protein